MKILCLSNFYPPYHEGGYEISVAQSIDFLSRSGFDTCVLCGDRGTESAPESKFRAESGAINRLLHYIDYHNASFSNKHQVELYNYRCTLQAIRDWHPDLIYIGNMKAVSIAPVLAAQKSGLPHVFDLGDIWLKTYLRPDLKSRCFRLLKALLPFTVGGKISLDPVIVPSQWMKTRLEQEYRSREVYVVPRGVELPSKYKQEETRPSKYIFSGRIEPLKGLHLLIQAWGKILQHNPSLDFHLDVYGDEDPVYIKECHSEIARLGLSGHIEFKGRVRSMQDIWQQYDVLLMPTLAEEAFGRVIIEAMANGLPVLATNAWGPAEIIRDGQSGWLFDPHEPDSLVQKLLLIGRMEPADFAARCLAARQLVETEYEISLVQNQTKNILENLYMKAQKTIQG